MKLKTIACLLVSATLCVSMFGCAGGSSDQSDSTQTETVSIDAAPIEIIETGFSMGNDSEVNYVFTMKNPNDGYIADRVTFSISGYDADGNMVLGAAESVERMFPGIDYAVAGTSYLVGDAAVERLEVSPSMDLVGWIETDVGSDAMANMFSVANPRTGRMSDTSVAINGRVVANDADALAAAEGVSVDAISANVCAVLIDTNGNFVAGGSASDLAFSEEESLMNPNDAGDNSASNEQAEQGDEGEAYLKAAPFSISVMGAPGFKECRYYVTPV